VVSQPYVYRRAELVEPDWRRFPGWSSVTTEEWESVQWQRAHCVKNLRQLRDVLGPGLSEEFLADLERDQREQATMSMLVPPQMVNTMAPAAAPGQPGFTDALYADPVRPDGPGRQPDTEHHQAQIRPAACRPADRHDRVSAGHPGCP
jgi:lysine 2,3-aminomutase